MGIHTHYDNLKVVRNAPDEVIRAAYKTLTQKYHPDRNPGDTNAARVMTLLNESYGVLSDPTKRRSHDEWISRAENEARMREARCAEAQRAAAAAAHAPKPQPASPPKASLAKWFVLWTSSLVANVFKALKPVIIFLVVIGVFAWLIGQSDDKTEPARTAQPYTATTQAIAGQPTRPSYVRPPLTPLGYAWPTAPAYLAGVPVLSDTGLSKVVVDNSQNDSDVFVKLVSVGGAAAFPVRSFYIPARGSFTMTNIDAGRYDIRYRDLSSGHLARSEAFTLNETPTSDGTEYSEYTMTLYKVVNGNMQTYDLNENDF
jgi:hypothetical protein